ncbi:MULTISPECIES: lytic transglycosylase domain-containing protein [Solibacillus]|uniref:Lytic transglycosylase domain-containing protein n=1 Tax=Solibacillus merdavium TaxID=2762218 RepID=A0ABR8XQ02_9BACL|nr:lytic transglycosylase domain-containing protein [Solibacillus merdavium]MBD8034012.1 lytic transglycosylase domain-containing protein [Solibacillus merdavium]
MTKSKKKQPLLSPKVKIYIIVLLIPISLTIYIFAFFSWQQIRGLPFIERFTEKSVYQQIQDQFDLEIPIEYIPVYVAAEQKYNVPWTLLAAHHRVETRFSTMRTLISPVGAEGHMQFMPCTFVGWKHPSCKDLGLGEIPEKDKTNPAVIKKYGGYGVDANGDGIADPFDIEDAIYSAAKFLSIAGVRNGELKKAVFQYNHSDAYVEDVLYYYKQYRDYGDQLKQIAMGDTK